MLKLTDVVKRYGTTLGVGPVSFAVEEGEFVTLLGPSGCGKTTTLHLIAGLLQSNEGNVEIGGRDVTGVEPQHRDIGLVFQNYALFPHKTVFDNVGFGLRMRKVPRGEIEARVTRMLDVVGLPGVERRLPRELSGGQQQRVAVARALVVEPKILLLDEPLSNLDAVLRKRMRLEPRDIQKRLGITAINVTHDQEEAFEMSDRVVLMNQGRIEQIGTPEQLYDAPASRFAAEFIGEAVFIDGRVVALNGTGAEVEASRGFRFKGVPRADGVKMGDEVYLLVRPERVEVSLSPHDRPDSVRATVIDRVFSGEQVSFIVAVESGLKFRAKKPSLNAYRDVAPGATVWVAPVDCRMVPRGP
ncbi:MAG: ABC transporter ATP-binding protein [Proteobacteria bacterium]|nr:ABC transporter ATP-binding protein [Pseudomonadota bacterium]